MRRRLWTPVFLIQLGGESAVGEDLGGFAFLRCGPLTLTVVRGVWFRWRIDFAGACRVWRWGPFVLTWWRGRR